MKRWARIWVNSPDETDGIYVELLEPMTPKSKLECQVDAVWFQTYDECEQWAYKNGATRIETI